MALAAQVRDTQAALLAAARSEILSRGNAAALSLRAVARRAGLSHQAPGHFFGSRTGLLTALATQELSRLQNHLQAAADRPAPTARARLSAVGIAYIEFACQHAALFGLVRGEALINIQDESFAAARTKTWQVLVNIVADAQSEGWRPRQPTDDVALICWTLVHGTATAWADGLIPLQYPGISINEVAQRIADSL